jgi:hypothetical protein
MFYLRYVTYVCLFATVVSNTLCYGFCFVFFRLVCPKLLACLSEFSIFDCPFGILWRLFTYVV